MYQYWNPNPAAAKVGDCTVRAISKAMGQTWEETYIQLALYGLMLSDMPSANAVWGAYLKDNGFSRYIIPDEYMTCTVSEFANNHPEGVYILALSGHVIAVIDHKYYDTWDSGAMTPMHYSRKLQTASARQTLTTQTTQETSLTTRITTLELSSMPSQRRESKLRTLRLPSRISSYLRHS